ncbi:MAG: patatin-like phospholipase family protein [Candidatus Marinimicrobia bacterium]|nr:patatin-like phospholipase family protein [Candidatus Neomarinimicrobiota bacterium]
MLNSGHCLVLSGGGAKGVYHIGVWRALQELGVKVDAFIGNSIGAIVAGFLAQGKFKRMEEIGSHMGIDFILNIPEEFIENGEVKINPAKLTGFTKFYKTIIDKKGLDTSPLRQLLKNNLDEEKIRKRGKDLGIVTFNISDMKPKKLFIEDMERGEVINYLLASSAFPGFERTEINGKKYIDGGVYDNIPFSMARQRGYKKIIVSDISGLGMRRKMDITGTQTIYIKNSINMGGVLDFDKQFLQDYTYLGYLDTLKTFEVLVGYNYFISPDEELETDFMNLICKDVQSVRNYAKTFLDVDAGTFSTSIKNIFPEYSRFEKNWLVVLVDCAAKILSVDRLRKYTYRELLVEINQQITMINKMVAKLKKGKLFNIEEFLKILKSGKDLVESPYYYYCLIDTFLKGRAQKLALRALTRIFPEIPAGIYFLLLLKNNGIRDSKLLAD